MKRPNYRRRRRGIYIHPLVKLAVVLLAAAGVFAYMRFVRAPQTKLNDPKTAMQDADVPEEKTLPDQITTPSGVACTLTRLDEDAVYTGDLVLVNNWTEFHFPDNQEDGLVSILENRTDSYYAKDGTVFLLPQAMDALNDWMDAFLAQGGSKSVQIVAAHRTKEYQQHLFDQSAERNGLEHAERYVAHPGCSEHHTGLVVDLGTMSGGFMDSVGEYTWLTENCQDYGWIVRYETDKEALTGISDEPWHFRYVGIPHASEIVRNGFCLEEYIDYLKNFPLDGNHLVIDCASGKYEVWYAEGCETYLPDSGSYSVSGNNVDGVIVTCKIG